MNDKTLEQIDAKLSALLAMATKSLHNGENGDNRKPEEVLAASGVKIDQIAAILGKSEAAIRKSLHRSRIRLRNN
jgi:hypothetical protein